MNYHVVLLYFILYLLDIPNLHFQFDICSLIRNDQFSIKRNSLSFKDTDMHLFLMISLAQKKNFLTDQFCQGRSYKNFKTFRKIMARFFIY